MKITDTLESLLRLLVTTDDDSQVKEDSSPARSARTAEHAVDRPLPDWVKRTTEQAEAPAPREAPPEPPPAPVVEATVPPLAVVETEHVEPEAPAAPVDQGKPKEEEEEEGLVPGLLEALVSWVQTQDPKPDPGAEEPAPEPLAATLEVAVEPGPEPVAEDEPVVHHERVPVAPQPVFYLPPVEPVADPDPVAEEPAPEALGAILEVAPEPEPEPEPERNVELVPARQDLSHLETAAHVAESLNLGFHLGSAVERIAAAATMGSEGIPALRDAAWLIERYIGFLEKRPIGADLHLTAARLARQGDAIAGLKVLADALEADAAPAPEEAAVEPEPVAVIPEPEPDILGVGRIRRLSPDPPLA